MREETQSVRLRRKREEVNQKINNQVDTLDLSTEISGVKNNLRKALRTKYTHEDNPVTIKHFGFIDQPAEVSTSNIQCNIFKPGLGL